MPAKPTLRQSWLLRYAIAVGAACAGLLVRQGLTALAGEGLPTYITFYPAVMAVALLGGFGPGLVVTGACALIADYWLLPPTGSLMIERPVDAVGLAFFLGMGLFMSLVAELYRRARERAAAYAGRVPPWERQEEEPRPWGEGLLLHGGLGLALVILAVSGWQGHRSLVAMATAERLADRSHASAEEVEHLLMALQDMEAGVRGYLITGEEQYLQAYHAASPDWTAHLAALKSESGESPELLSRLARLEKLGADRLALWTEAIELYRTQGLAAVQAMLAAGRGRVVSKEIRRELAEVQAVEVRVQQTRTQAKQASLEQARRSLVRGGVLSILILASVFTFLNRENAARRRAEAEARRHRDHLQDIVTARTADLARANESLRQSQEDLARAQEVGLIGWWRLDTRRNVLTWSDENYRIFGVPPGTPLTYETFLGAVHPDDREHVNGRWEAALCGEPYDLEHRIVAEGKVKWVREKAYLELDPAGKLLGGFGITQDITDRKLAEEALRESEQFIKSVAEASPHWFYVFDLESLSLTYANRPILGDLGYPPEVQNAVTGLDAFRDYMPPEEMPHLARMLHEWQTLPDGVVRGDEYRLRHADGSLRCFEGREIVFARGPDGRVRRVLGLLLDITDRKLAEEALRESEEQLRRHVADLQTANAEVQAARRAAVNLMEDAVVAREQAEQVSAELRSLSEQRRLALEAADLGTWDYHFQTGEVFWDQRCRELWGMAQSEQTDYATAIGRIHPEDRPGVDQAVQAALAGQDGGAYHREFRVVWPDESVHWLASHGRVYFDTEGHQQQPVRFIGALREITAQKHAQAALQQTAADLERSNRDLEQFAYVASHDLQEPLRAVGGYVKLLEHRFPHHLDAKARGYIAGALDGAQRMERLINDLLALSRIGTQGGTFVPTGLDAVLDQVLHNLEASINASGATITRGHLPVLAVDETQMVQLLQNLIGNALKFRGEDPPRIHVGAEARDGAWVFSVRDNGIGIEPAYFERVFLLFQRLHTRKTHPGTGIGLTICKRIVERHGGRIWVESQPGQGATFFFALPDGSAGKLA